MSQLRRAMMRASRKSDIANPNILAMVDALKATNYEFAQLILGQQLTESQQVTLQIKLTVPLSSSRPRMRVFYADASHIVYEGTNADAGKDYFSMTFAWSVYGKNNKLRCYGLPSGSDIGIEIEWAKLEIGNIATPFNGYLTE